MQEKRRQTDQAFPEIRIPGEFIAKFEIEKGLCPGDTAGASRELLDEMRIRYL